MTNTRTITTSVFVNDGDVLVLGGLIDDQMLPRRAARAGHRQDPGPRLAVPRAQERARQDNLMVFIRPTILRNAADARFKTGEKYSYIQELQRQMASDPVELLKDEKQPLLPPLPPGPEESLQQPAAPGSAAPQDPTAPPTSTSAPKPAMAVNPTSDDAAPLDAVAIEPARNLPFAFAKRNGVLIQGASRTACSKRYTDAAPSPLVLAEVRRFAGGPVHFTEVDRRRSTPPPGRLRERRRDDDGRGPRRRDRPRRSPQQLPEPRTSSTATTRRRSSG